ncbi:unnamed protein product [Zymoseptoria tritici ST99CH_1A5]|uniref:Thioredoxin domain-containing protein n=2 Tax=Zymoseptoria tritici TaxID=1047171 RepID=A0A2H1G4T3_ZYMTR|nr:unnamed protein product [Zymoseptoria tritici ST99CH_1E4]SMR49755.1 unnamed protein product [Zymoseptoria tritici ST99CH_3D1]SMY22453.1 unnamed protein product [Zymoseptoria tritici ST99CH_1A5]
MSSKVIPITSTAHFSQTLQSSTYLIVDFYADWCGPCKVISPVFEQLAAQESKPGRIIFAKVNVDTQAEVAKTFSISAMPTFLILRGSKVIETVRGANPSALRSAILSAAADAAKAPARTSPIFSSKGQTLGGAGATSRPAPTSAASLLPNVNFSQLLSAPGSVAQGRGWVATVVRFLGLYVTTMFSFDPNKTAEESPFAVKRSNVKSR